MRFRCLILNDAIANSDPRTHFVSAKLKFRITSATCGPLWALGSQKTTPLPCVALGLLNNLITVFNSFSICACISTYTSLHLYEYLLILLLILISMIIHILVGIYTYMHTYIHIHIHIHLYIHTHICIDNCPPSSGRHAM